MIIGFNELVNVDDLMNKLTVISWNTARVNEQINRRPKMKFIKKIFKNEDGATAIEYGLIAALIAVAAITAMSSLGTNLSNTFTKVSNKL